ncbi:Protein of unknown function [Cotesia congregata]|uniref:Uncharacterized protein n=1 Tax=Cotesia congregata TaxID=51543 RepID=A0A8J2HAU4_COTCN|nr:Protein of unknown function [Cotesia congregata]
MQMVRPKKNVKCASSLSNHSSSSLKPQLTQYFVSATSAELCCCVTGELALAWAWVGFDEVLTKRSDGIVAVRGIGTIIFTSRGFLASDLTIPLLSSWFALRRTKLAIIH